VISTVLLIGCVAMIAVAQLFILHSALRATFTPRDGAALSKPRRAAEVAWALLPAIALMLVLWVTWRAAAPPPAHHEHTGHAGHAS
jgi:heme/copper-type cytochrome/quinol oxidase subunit 2